jgi:hypothetical protein
MFLTLLRATESLRVTPSTVSVGFFSVIGRVYSTPVAADAGKTEKTTDGSNGTERLTEVVSENRRSDPGLSAGQSRIEPRWEIAVLGMEPPRSRGSHAVRSVRQTLDEALGHVLLPPAAAAPVHRHPDLALSSVLARSPFNGRLLLGHETLDPRQNQHRNQTDSQSDDDDDADVHPTVPSIPSRSCKHGTTRSSVVSVVEDRFAGFGSVPRSQDGPDLAAPWFGKTAQP